MPVIESAKKRVKVNEKKRKKNRVWKDKLRDTINDLNEVLENGDQEEAEEQFRETVKIIDKCASKGLMHKNKAARKKSYFAKKLNNLKEKNE